LSRLWLLFNKVGNWRGSMGKEQLPGQGVFLFVARVAPICLIRILQDIFRKPGTSSYARPVWRKNRHNGPCAWKLPDGKCFFADVPIVRMYFVRTPTTTSNVYKARSPMRACSVRLGAVPQSRGGGGIVHIYPDCPAHP